MMVDSMDVDDTDLAGLTEQEIAAITDPEHQDVGGQDHEDETITEDQSEDTDDPAVSDDESDDVPVESVAQEREPFVPEYKAQAPDNIDDQYIRLNQSYETLSAELEQKFENGDLSFVDYRQQARELDSRFFAEKARLDESRIKSTIAKEQAEQAAEQRWQWEQDTFFRDNHDFKKDPVLYGALDATLKVMA